MSFGLLAAAVDAIAIDNEGPDRQILRDAAAALREADLLLLGATAKLEGMEAALDSKDRYISGLEREAKEDVEIKNAAVRLVESSPPQCSGSIMAMNEAWHDLQVAVNGEVPPSLGGLL